MIRELLAIGLHDEVDSGTGCPTEIALGEISPDDEFVPRDLVWSRGGWTWLDEDARPVRVCQRIDPARSLHGFVLWLGACCHVKLYVDDTDVCL